MLVNQSTLLTLGIAKILNFKMITKRISQKWKHQIQVWKSKSNIVAFLENLNFNEKDANQNNASREF